MIIVANNKDLRLDFRTETERFGAYCPQGVEVTVADSMARYSEFQELVDAGEISIVSYSNKASSAVVQQEFEGYAEGMYQAALSLEGVSLVHQPAITFASLTITAGGFDLTKNNIFIFLINKLHQVEVEIAKGFYDTAGLLAAFQAEVELALYLDVVDNAGDIDFRTKAGGSNAAIEMLSGHAFDGARQVGLFEAESAPILPATEQAEIVKVDMLAPGNVGASGGRVILEVYSAAVGGTKLTNVQWQRVTKGTVVSGLYSDTLEIKANALGEIEVELMSPAPAGDVYVSLLRPTGLWLADVPTTREQVTTAAGT